MRILILIVFGCLLSIASFLPAQTLNGKIINGIGEEGLPNVQVGVQGMSTSFSDPQLGTFSISLPGLRPGMKVPLDIQKDGYAVINREATQPYLPDNPLDRVMIYMAPAKERNELALQFYKISVERNIQVNFDAAAKRFAEEANYEAIGKLHADKERALKMSDSLAARLSRFDPMLASNELTQAMQLYQAGKVEEALKVLDIEKIKRRMEERNQMVAELETANQQDIASLMKAGDMALSEFQFGKAQEYYETAVLADTTNLENLRILCKYLLLQRQSKTLIHFAEMMRKSALMKDHDWYVSVAMNYRGLGLYGQNQHDEAIASYEAALDIRRSLSKEDPLRFKPKVALTLNNLGVAFYNLKRYAEAISSYEEALEIQQRLSKENPQEFEPYVAASLNNLGVTYRNMKRYAEALSYYEEALEMRRRLSKDNPLRWESHVAMTLLNRGNIFVDLNRDAEALSSYEEALEIYQRISQNNPQRFEPDMAKTLGNRGDTYVDLMRYSEAISSYEEALEVYQRLSKQNRHRFEPNVAMTFNKLGDTYRNWNLNHYTKATSPYEAALKIYQRLSKENPKGFEPMVVWILNKLSGTYTDLNRLDSAIYCFNEVIALDSSSAYTYNNRGNVYRKLQQYELAKEDVATSLSLDGDNGWAYATLAMIHADQDNVEGCYENLEIAIEKPLAYPLHEKVEEEETLKRLAGEERFQELVERSKTKKP